MRGGASSAADKHGGPDVDCEIVLPAVPQDLYLCPHHSRGRPVLRARLRSRRGRDLRTHQRREAMETHQAQV
eukprot:bmy_01617T0